MQGDGVGMARVSNSQSMSIRPRVPSLPESFLRFGCCLMIFVYARTGLGVEAVTIAPTLADRLTSFLQVWRRYSRIGSGSGPGRDGIKNVEADHGAFRPGCGDVSGHQRDWSNRTPGALSKFERRDNQ